MEGLTGVNAPTVKAMTILSDGLPFLVTDAEDASSNSGVVSFDNFNYKAGESASVSLVDQDLNVDSDLLEIYTTVSASDSDDIAFGTVGEPGLPELSFGPLGRLLDVEFDGSQWRSPQGTCSSQIFGQNTGLDADNFTLVETDRDSGEFIAEFRVPENWCRSDDGASETTLGLDMTVNYVDFRNVDGQVTEVTATANVLDTNNPDITPPTISPVSDIASVADDPSGVVVDYDIPQVTDDSDPNPSIMCNPAPGTKFAVGTTKVTCTATDFFDNEAVVTFNVTVLENENDLVRKITEQVIFLSEAHGPIVESLGQIEVVFDQLRSDVDAFNQVQEQITGAVSQIVPALNNAISDIEQLQNENDALQNQVSELESRIAELEIALQNQQP